MNNREISKQFHAGVDILTGTLGRINTALEADEFNLEHVRFLVFDEADRLLEQENLNSIFSLYNRIPHLYRPLQVLIFSATLQSSGLDEVITKICRFPQRVTLNDDNVVPSVRENQFFPSAPSPTLHSPAS